MSEWMGVLGWVFTWTELVEYPGYELCELLYVACAVDGERVGRDGSVY